MAGKPGPQKRFPHTLEVKLTEDLNDFITDLAKTLGTSKAAVLRALAEDHMKYLTSLASQYVSSGVALAEMEEIR